MEEFSFLSDYSCNVLCLLMAWGNQKSWKIMLGYNTDRGEEPESVIRGAAAVLFTSADETSLS